MRSGMLSTGILTRLLTGRVRGPILPRMSRSRCSRCRKSGHNARTCSERTASVRTCTKCLKSRPAASFLPENGWCLGCRRAYNTPYVRARRAQRKAS